MWAVVVFIAGAVLAVVLQELGAWSERWSEALIRSRSRFLARGRRQEWIDAATERMGEVPGEWSKFSFTYFKLKTGRVPVAASQQEARVTRRLALLGPLTAAAVVGMGGVQLLHLAGLSWLLSALVGCLMGAISFSTDRLRFILIPDPRLWRRLLNAVPSLVVTVVYSGMFSTGLVYAVYKQDVQAAVGSNAGLLENLRAISDLANDHIAVWITQLLVTLIVVIPALLPILLPPSALAGRFPRHSR